MGFKSKIVMLGFAAVAGLILFTSWNLDEEHKQEDAGNLAFAAVPCVSLMLLTFWATSDMYKRSGKNYYILVGLSVLLSLFVGLYFGYVIDTYKTAAKEPVVTTSYGTRSIEDNESIEFFIRFQYDWVYGHGKINYPSAAWRAQLEADCDAYIANPSAAAVKKCMIMKAKNDNCEIAADGKTATNCFNSVINTPLTAEFTVDRPTWVHTERGNTSTPIGAAIQTFTVKFAKDQFTAMITPANCLDIKLSSGGAECAYGFTLQWRFNNDLPHGNIPTENGDFFAPVYGPNRVTVTTNNKFATDSAGAQGARFELINNLGPFSNENAEPFSRASNFPSNWGGDAGISFLSEWFADIDVHGKETLRWSPRFFQKYDTTWKWQGTQDIPRESNPLGLSTNVRVQTGDFELEFGIYIIVQASDYKLPVEIRTSKTTIPFFAIFTALMAFLTPMMGIFGFFFPNTFPARYAQFGEQPDMFQKWQEANGDVEMTDGNPAGNK